VIPIENWLTKRGVHFDMDTQVLDIDFERITYSLQTALSWKALTSAR